MLPAERKIKIIELVTKNRIASISKLSQELNVSETTIRRDIAEIENEGLLKRTYGGVLLDGGANIEPPFPERSQSQIEQKERIGRQAAQLVEDGDHIILDSGTTTPFIARHLVNRHGVTVVTNDMNVASQLRDASGVHVIVTGGSLYRSGYVLSGLPTDDFLGTLHVQKVFLGAQAIHPKYGITQSESELVTGKRLMIQAAQQVIVVADDTKIGKVTLHTIAPIEHVHTFITGSEAHNVQIEQLRESGIRVLVV